MIIRATFTGQNGSMGFINGKEYQLFLYQHKPLVIRSLIWITPAVKRDGMYFNISDEYVPYSTIETFLQNWDQIKVIEK